MTITICVCGAGTMGKGIAQVAAQSGFSTILFDVNNEALDNAVLSMQRNMNFLEEKGKISAEEKKAILKRLQFTTNLEDCIGEVIIEAIAENEGQKISLFNELAKSNNEEVIFASNTSSLSITALQEKIQFPERVVGMHFFNPPYLMQLVEIVKGSQTIDAVIMAIVDICKQMGKVAVICNDVPGFIVNRVARHYYLEALKITGEGIASFEEIDSILEASGFRMGPFKLMDLIGMDINLSVSQSMYQAFNKAERFKPSPVQIEMVKKGLLGKKSGRGFYSYPNLVK